MIHVGQAGCRIGYEFWNSLLGEYNIGPNGKSTEENKTNEEVFLKQVKDNKYIPRSVFVDTDPECISQIKSGYLKNLFDPDHMIFGTEGTSNNVTF